MAYQQQLGSISSGIETLSQVLSLLEAFRAFDSDNDGFITIDELAGILGSLGLGYANASKENHMRAMMQEGDKDRDGLLSTQEFLEMNTKDFELGQLLANSLRTAFQAFDHGDNQDNIVTADELYEVMINGSGLGNNLCLEDCQDIVVRI